MSSSTSITLPACLDDVKLTTLPNSAYYISSFMTPSEEEYLLHKIQSQPATSWRNLTHRRLQAYPSALTPAGEMRAGQLPIWLAEPMVSRLMALRLASDRGEDTAPIADREDVDRDADRDADSSSPESSKGKTLFSASPHLRPNHILVNEYPAGTGIAAHEDGPAYHPLVATVSLGGHTVLDIYPKNAEGRVSQPQWRILQERRSLLVTTDDVYRETLHGIRDVVYDEGLDADGLANWELLREETRDACGNGMGRLQRELRISATIRDVFKVRDYSRLIPGLGGRR